MFCTEYCGTGHSDMLAKVRVVEPAEFDAWLEKASMGGGSPEEVGKKLYTLRGCNACHTLDGVSAVGPTFKGLFGKEEELVDGTKVKVDENYIRESVLNPMTKVVKGFVPAMPTFQGQLNDDQLNALIAFIKAQQ